MSTIGLENWVVDLKNVGAIYPFQSYEKAMVIAAFAFWILWHLWQFGQEGEEFRHKTSRHNDDHDQDATDRY